jgi:hypothetical protein
MSFLKDPSISDPYQQKLLRQTEEIVTAARLEQIAKDHKSIGSVLDTRRIQPLDDIRFSKDKKSLRIDIEKRVSTRRGARTDVDISNNASAVVEQFKEKGINPQLMSGNYQLEEALWRDKTRKLAYSSKRRFMSPLLHEYLHLYILSSKEKAVEYHTKVSETLIKLVDKLRKECLELKTEMDRNGIFHPEANAHRVHCIYLSRLNKMICCDNIEDPVIKELFVEHLQKEKYRGVELNKEQLAYLEEKEIKKARKQQEKENKLFMSFQKKHPHAKTTGGVNPLQRSPSNGRLLKPLPSSSKNSFFFLSHFVIFVFMFLLLFFLSWCFRIFVKV